MRRSGIKKLVCMEGALYGVESAVYGGMIGAGLSYLLYRIVVGIREFAWRIPWAWISTAAVGAVLIALISGYIPLKRINEGIIVENIRFEE